MNIRKNYLLLGFVIASIILLPISSVNALPKVTDATDDVRYYNGATLLNTGDFQDEIDFETMEIDGTNLVVTFQDVPQYDDDHRYYAIIIWDLADWIDNFTSAFYGKGDNSVSTYLADETPTIIVAVDVPDSITVVGNTLQIPIPEHALISNLNNPLNFSAYARVDSGATEYYYDEMEGVPSTNVFPGYTIFAVISSLTILTLIALKRKKK